MAAKPLATGPVVSKILFSSHFLHFPTIESITKNQLSISDAIVVQKKFQSRMKVHFQWVGLLFSSHSFPQITFFGNNTIWF